MVMIGCAGVAGRCNNIAGCSDAPRNANLRDICANATESYLKTRDVFTSSLASICSRFRVGIFMSYSIFVKLCPEGAANNVRIVKHFEISI